VQQQHIGNGSSGGGAHSRSSSVSSVSSTAVYTAFPSLLNGGSAAPPAPAPVMNGGGESKKPLAVVLPLISGAGAPPCVPSSRVAPAPLAHPPQQHQHQQQVHQAAILPTLIPTVRDSNKRHTGTLFMCSTLHAFHSADGWRVPVCLCCSSAWSSSRPRAERAGNGHHHDHGRSGAAAASGPVLLIAPESAPGPLKASHSTTPQFVDVCACLCL
jgi:hypothetical protein